VPFADEVNERFRNWLAQSEARGRKFSDEQQAWLELIRDHIASSLSIELDDLEYTPFAQRGGTSRAYQTFGDDLLPLLNELNEVLAA
jgi:type I restriction enzyme R subunit